MLLPGQALYVVRKTTLLISCLGAGEYSESLFSRRVGPFCVAVGFYSSEWHVQAGVLPAVGSSFFPSMLLTESSASSPDKG